MDKPDKISECLPLREIDENIPNSCGASSTSAILDRDDTLIDNSFLMPYSACGPAPSFYDDIEEQENRKPKLSILGHFDPLFQKLENSTNALLRGEENSNSPASEIIALGCPSRTKPESDVLFTVTSADGIVASSEYEKQTTTDSLVNVSVESNSSNLNDTIIKKELNCVLQQLSTSNNSSFGSKLQTDEVFDLVESFQKCVIEPLSAESNLSFELETRAGATFDKLKSHEKCIVESQRVTSNLSFELETRTDTTSDELKSHEKCAVESPRLVTTPFRLETQTSTISDQHKPHENHVEAINVVTNLSFGLEANATEKIHEEEPHEKFPVPVNSVTDSSFGLEAQTNETSDHLELDKECAVEPVSEVTNSSFNLQAQAAEKSSEKCTSEPISVAADLSIGLETQADNTFDQVESHQQWVVQPQGVVNNSSFDSGAQAEIIDQSEPNQKSALVSPHVLTNSFRLETRTPEAPDQLDQKCVVEAVRVVSNLSFEFETPLSETLDQLELHKKCGSESLNVVTDSLFGLESGTHEISDQLELHQKCAVEPVNVVSNLSFELQVRTDETSEHLELHPHCGETDRNKPDSLQVVHMSDNTEHNSGVSKNVTLEGNVAEAVSVEASNNESCSNVNNVSDETQNRHANIEFATSDKPKLLNYSKMMDRVTMFELENEELKSKIATLERESATLKSRNKELEENSGKQGNEANSFRSTETALKNEIKELKIVNKQLESNLKEMKSKEAKLADDLNHKTQSEMQISRVMEEYEKSISSLVAENEKMKQERDTAQMHLANIELAFSDVHQKYERCKTIVLGFKKNEEMLQQNIEANEETIMKQEQKYETLKVHAMSQLEKSNQELASMKKQHEQEVARLSAQLRRIEIKNNSLLEALQQKTKECEQLSAVCDEFIGNV